MKKNHTTSDGTNNMVGILAPVIYIMREKNDDQVKLNFTLSVSLAGVSLRLIDAQSNSNTVVLTRLQSQTDLNNIYEKHSLRLKRFEIVSNGTSGGGGETVIVSSDHGLADATLGLHSSTSAVSKPTFLDVTFTRALISNFNKRVGGGGHDVAAKRDRFFERLEARILKRHRHHPHQTEQKCISELNVNVHNLDVVFRPEKLSPIIEQCLSIVGLFASTEPAPLIPFIRACDMPLLNIEIDRLEMPPYIRT